MRYILLLFPLLFLSLSPDDNAVEERIGVKGPLKFNNTNFHLYWTDRPRDNYRIQEYLPKGEKAESFNQMMSIHLFSVNISVEEAVNFKIAELTERQKTDPVCKYKVTENKDKQEVIVDFLLGESKDNAMSVVEFNVYRYKQIILSNRETGIIVYAYSKRSYGADITPFFGKLKEERNAHINEMSSTKIPAIKINMK